MLYAPSPIANADVGIAQRPFLGGEFAVYYTFKQATLLATVTLTGATTGTLLREPGTVLPAAPGANLQLALLTPLYNAPGDLAVTVSAKGATTATLEGTATFANPSWLRDQSGNWPLGASQDIITTADEKFVTGSPDIALGTVANGVAGTKLGLYQLPEVADWILIGCTGEIRVSDKSRRPKNIACGLNQSAFIKPGNTEIGTVNVSSKVRSFLEGLQRIRGQRVTLMCVGTKEDTVTTDRMVLTSAIMSTPVRVPEGDGEVMAESEGQYEDALFFAAAQAT